MTGHMYDTRKGYGQKPEGLFVLTLSVEPSLNGREELAAGCYCGDDTRVR